MSTSCRRYVFVRILFMYLKSTPVLYFLIIKKRLDDITASKNKVKTGSCPSLSWRPQDLLRATRHKIPPRIHSSTKVRWSAAASLASLACRVFSPLLPSGPSGFLLSLRHTKWLASQDLYEIYCSFLRHSTLRSRQACLLPSFKGNRILTGTFPIIQ